jgi:hypothetical protein
LFNQSKPLQAVYKLPWGLFPLFKLLRSIVVIYDFKKLSLLIHFSIDVTSHGSGGSSFNLKSNVVTSTISGKYRIINSCGSFHKNSRITLVAILVVSFGACGMQPAALGARRGIIQLAVFAGCIIFKYLHATEQHFVAQSRGV